MDALNSPFPYDRGMEINPVSVLVIENHPLMREALCLAIADEPDLKVAEADLDSSQTRVLPLLDDVLFVPQELGIVLLALGNPGLTELDALKTLRRTLPDTPILALTRNEVPGQEQAALEAGADAVLTKATPRRELIERLRELGTARIMNSPDLNSGRGRKNNRLTAALPSQNCQTQQLADISKKTKRKNK